MLSSGAFENIWLNATLHSCNVLGNETPRRFAHIVACLRLRARWTRGIFYNVIGRAWVARRQKEIPQARHQKANVIFCMKWASKISGRNHNGAEAAARVHPSSCSLLGGFLLEQNPKLSFTYIWIYPWLFLSQNKLQNPKLIFFRWAWTFRIIKASVALLFPSIRYGKWWINVSKITFFARECVRAIWIVLKHRVWIPRYQVS